MVYSVRLCKDCGLAIEGQMQYCEFCLARRVRQYGPNNPYKKAKAKKRAPVKGGWRGRPCGGGRGVVLDDRDFFGDGYAVAVAADPAERVERSTLGEDMAAGNPGDDMAEGEPCSS